MNKLKYLAIGMLIGAFALPFQWIGEPVQLAIGQTVTVDSTQSPIVVNAMADLADLTPSDGQSVIIKTGTEKGLWYYDKDSAAVVDSVAVLTGPGSVGRFLVITNDIGSIAAATAITAAQIDNDVDIEFGVFDADSPRSLTLAELKKTGVQVYNVLQYGADPTYTTDSTTAIQDAIDAVPSTGGVVYFPIGNYKVTSTITIEDKGPLTICGQSTPAVLGSTAVYSSQIVPDAAFGATTAVFDVVSNNANHAADHGGITFKDLMIRPYSGVRGYAINVRKGASETNFWGDIKLDNVCVRYCTVGFRLTDSGGEGYGWIYVDDSRLEACTYGIWSDTTINNMVVRDSIIRQNTIGSNGSYTSRSGGGIVLAYGTALVVSGCDLEGQQVGIETQMRDVVISGNYFEINHDASIVLIAASDVVVEGNYFTNDTKCGQIYMNQCVNVDIKNNTNAKPVLMSINRDIFCDSWADVLCSGVCATMSTTNATQTLSGITTVCYSERGAARLNQLGREATITPAYAPQNVNTSITAASEGPNGQTSLVASVNSTSASGFFSLWYDNVASATNANAIAYTVTGSSDVFTVAATPYIVGEQVSFQTAGTMPTGLDPGKWYYVTAVTATTFTVSATHGGSNVSPSSAGSGTLYVTNKGEYFTQSCWVKPLSTNTTGGLYCVPIQAINGGTAHSHSATHSSTFVPADQWTLINVISKIPAGITVAAGGVDTSMKYYQLTSGNVNHTCGFGATKSRNPFTVPKYMYYFTDVGEEFLQRIDERHYIWTGAPTSTVFNWAVGTQIEYLTPVAGGNIGLVCTTAGTPGTWKTFGAVAP